jgi:hypothetical protein
MPTPTILALDFDGVLCNGLVEYFDTSWQAYCQLFEETSITPPIGLTERFYALRPVIETGWEMPLLIHALIQGVEDEAVLIHWSELVQKIVTATGITTEEAAAAVDGVRDRWIQTDLTGWLDRHRFYPGVILWLQRAIAQGSYPIIISTKEGRFIQALLAKEGVTLAPEQIIGKEIKQPKTTTLEQLLANPPIARSEPFTIWFFEDRYKTLEKVKAVEALAEIELFLVDWGYNTAIEKDKARCDRRIHLLSLAQLVREFSELISKVPPGK